MSRRQPHSRCGVILVITLMIIAALALVTMSLQLLSRSSLAASHGQKNNLQARQAAMSGIRRAIALRMMYPDDAGQWLDNPEGLADQPVVVQDGQIERGWYFTVYAPGEEDEVRYGIIDEASKINLMATDAETMLASNLLSPAQIDCLIDWIDKDDEERPEGAESQFYLSRTPVGHEAKNDQLLTVEELLLVAGFDAPTLWGEDANFNGTLEPNENDGDETFPPDNADGVLQRGLLSKFTVVSWDRDTNNAGKPRININGSSQDLAKLDDTDLPAETIEFIRFVRGRNIRFSHPVMLYDLEYQGQSSGVGADELPMVLDLLSVSPSTGKRPLPGRININTAPEDILAAIADIGEELAANLVAARRTLDPAQKNSAAWLVGEGVMTKEDFRDLSGRITGRSLQFRIRSVGYHRPSGQFCALEAIVDIAQGKPRILYLRELTRCGLPVIPGDSATTVIGG